jgi:hypothetical protein
MTVYCDMRGTGGTKHAWVSSGDVKASGIYE